MSESTVEHVEPKRYIWTIKEKDALNVYKLFLIMLVFKLLCYVFPTKESVQCDTMGWLYSIFAEFCESMSVYFAVTMLCLIIQVFDFKPKYE